MLQSRLAPTPDNADDILAVNVARTVIESQETPKDALKAVQEIVSLGIPRRAAFWAYFAITGGWPPAICAHCGARFTRNFSFARWCRKCDAAGPGRVISSEARRREIARSTANVAVRRGKLQPQPCETCGNPTAEKHHSDYSKPLQVIWLCRCCHMGEHAGKCFP